MEIVKRDVLQIQNKLENIIGCGFGGNQVLDLLKALQELPIDGTVLTKTKITMTVTAVKKNSFDNQVVRLVNDLTKKWKKIIAESSSGRENSTPSDKSSKKQNEAGNGKQKDQERSDSTHIAALASSKKAVSVRQNIREIRSAAFKANGTQKNNSKKGTSQSVKAAAPISSNASDPVRQKNRERLCAAIKGDGTSVEGAGDNWWPEHLAKILEECIHTIFTTTDKKYMSAIRSKIFNLRDVHNPQLRLNFLHGDISPQSLAKMTSEEMASEKLKAMRDKITKKGINGTEMVPDESIIS